MMPLWARISGSFKVEMSLAICCCQLVVVVVVVAGLLLVCLWVAVCLTLKLTLATQYFNLNVCLVENCINLHSATNLCITFCAFNEHNFPRKTHANAISP